MKRLITFAVALLILQTGWAQSDIISAAEFAKLQKTDKNVRIIDASKASNYKKSHLKNAVNIPHLSLYQENNEIEGVIKSPAELATIFGQKGISEKNTIVVYDEGSQKYSTRIYWILKYLGAPNVKVLHKDLAEWKKARLPLTQTVPSIKKTTFNPKVNKSIFASLDNVVEAVNDDNAVIVDARTPEEYNGTSVDNPSEGHIPGAVNLPYTELLTSSKAFKPETEIKNIVKAKGITPDKTIYLYCRTSVRAGVIYLALTNILNYQNVKVFDGAYAEWSANYELEQ